MEEKPKKYPIRVFIVDDHQMFIDGIKLLLEPDENIVIAGEANNGVIALEKIKQNPEIDLVITDINMPEMSGIELTEELRGQFPEIKILVLTMYNDRGIINKVIEAEADGYILKNTGRAELIKAINKISDDGTYYCNEVVSIVSDSKERKKEIDEAAKLTARETEILKLVCFEYSTPEIADKLCISPYTVDTHRKNILKKAKTKTIVGLIKFAITHKFVNFD